MVTPIEGGIMRLRTGQRAAIEKDQLFSHLQHNNTLYPRLYDETVQRSNSSLYVLSIYVESLA